MKRNNKLNVITTIFKFNLMRKLRFFFAMLVLLPLSIGSSLAETVTFDYADYKGQGTTSSGSAYTMVKSDVSIGDTKFFGNNSYAHFYASGVTTITPSTGVTITQIVLNASGGKLQRLSE